MDLNVQLTIIAEGVSKLKTDGTFLSLLPAFYFFIAQKEKERN